MNYKKIILAELEKSEKSWDECQAMKNKIDDKINKMRRSIERLKEKRSLIHEKFYFSTNDALKSIGNQISKKPNVIYGPFGIASERTLYILKDVDKCITDESNVLKSLTIINSGLDACIRTHEKVNNFADGTIGDLNGYNRKSYLISELSDRKIKSIMKK